MNDKKIINAALWFFALCVGVILLTSCNPYLPSVNFSEGTATPSPAATVTNQIIASDKLIATPPPACTVNAGAVYLRKGASMAHAAIDVLHSGDVLRVIYHGKKWILAQTPQRMTGWVYSKYCKE